MLFDKNVWFTRIKVLILSGIFASIANWISTMKSGKPVLPWEAAPALIAMFFIIVVACLIDETVRKFTPIKLPNIIYISMLTLVLSIPGFTPMGNFMIAEFSKIGLLPLCTPILAYAGIAIGKDLEDFKKQGLAIMVTACLTFIGTFIGSALIAHLILKAQGII